MKRIIAGATGFVGNPLVQSWLKENIDVIVIGRSKEKIEKIFDKKVTAITWQEFESENFDYSDVQCMVNLTGAGIADKRWTAERKEIILKSRIDSTRACVDFCIKHKVSLINASAVGIYSQQTPVPNGLPTKLDEDAVLPGDETGDFLSEVCRKWEASTQPAKDAGVRTVNLRIGVVLGKEGGALVKMALPFYLFAGGPIGSGHQPVAWIARKDICRAINFIIEDDKLQGAVNLVSPKCVTQKNLGHALGKALHRPSFMPTPGFVLKLVLGQLADELLLNGQHVYPKKLIEAGFEFQYADIQTALDDIYK